EDETPQQSPTKDSVSSWSPASSIATPDFNQKLKFLIKSGCSSHVSSTSTGFATPKSCKKSLYSIYGEMNTPSPIGSVNRPSTSSYQRGGGKNHVSDTDTDDSDENITDKINFNLVSKRKRFVKKFK
ncbi:uncharacterized protein LOC144357767, partial [Saccoglossus kowalevskii]